MSTEIATQEKEAPDREPTLGAVLHDHAVTRARPTFVAQMLDGALMASLALFSHRKPWIAIALLGVSVGMHGLWSLAELRVSESEQPTRAWRLTRGAAAVGGVVAVFALLLTLFGKTLGTWIS